MKSEVYMLFWMNKNSCDQMKGKCYCYYLALVSCNTVMHGHQFVAGLTVSTTGWLSVVLFRRWGQTNTPSSRSVVQSYGEPLCNMFEHILHFIDGVKIYRKSLKEAGKGRSHEIQAKVRIRSRQQRVS